MARSCKMRRVDAGAKDPRASPRAAPHALAHVAPCPMAGHGRAVTAMPLCRRAEERQLLSEAKLFRSPLVQRSDSSTVDSDTEEVEDFEGVEPMNKKAPAGVSRAGRSGSVADSEAP
ncbi:hypothetical protein ZWY2020_021017 [Hordeum vulgare]|nr:hypothetical protein ZWY2020_021017 [Hordeum vulgare]